MSCTWYQRRCLNGVLADSIRTEEVILISASYSSRSEEEGYRLLQWCTRLYAGVAGPQLGVSLTCFRSSPGVSAPAPDRARRPRLRHCPAPLSLPTDPLPPDATATCPFLSDILQINH
ncbi:hypothetical protein ABZP36_014643 [Zizania latifolia]